MTASTPTSVFPGLLSDNIGLYRTRPENFLASLLVHAVALALVLWLATWIPDRPNDPGPRVSHAINVGPISFLPQEPGGHGGGGTRDPLPASRGALPTLTLADQLTPPEAVPLNPDPKLPEPPSVMALSDLKLLHLAQLGDPLAAVQGPPSNGPGSGGGIGSNCCGGVGPRSGPGFGPYDAGNVFRPGIGGVTQPRPIYEPDPDYSEAARKAKYQGAVVLWLVVGADGLPHNIGVQRSLGMGLDEKAIAAVSTWRFQPATLNGQPVAVEVNVQVSFRLY
ncbi:MAG: energy transducer TonB [Terriglobales bacterium]